MAHLIGRIERVGARPLEDADRDRRLVVEQTAQRVEVRAELHATHVAHARDLPFGVGADDDVRELLFRRQSAARVDRELELRVDRRRRRAEDARRHLHVLLTNRADDVGRRELARGEAIRIEPDAHAELAGAEHLRAAHAWNARELVLHAQVGVVREIEVVVALVGRDEVHDHDEVGRRLLGDDADALHFGGQPRQRLRDAVLHLHLRVVEIGAEREGDRERHPAIGCRLREHVEHVLDAVHLLLERRGHRFGDDLRVGSRIGRAHDDRRRHDLRVFADRQLQERQGAGCDDQQRQHGREDRALDEELGEIHDDPQFVAGWLRSSLLLRP